MFNCDGESKDKKLEVLREIAELMTEQMAGRAASKKKPASEGKGPVAVEIAVTEAKPADAKDEASIDERLERLNAEKQKPDSAMQADEPAEEAGDEQDQGQAEAEPEEDDEALSKFKRLLASRF